MYQSVKQYFVACLMEWHERDNNRFLPWKGEKDPYKIWLSEIILQQTRSEQGLPYYEKFIAHFPSVKDLADADPEFVMKMWQGLGYYSRCKNLIKAANQIVNDYNGYLPSSYDELLKISGIGPYTAAAIASFGFGHHNAVIDGNVYRVLSRYFGIDEPIDTSSGKQLFSSLANELIVGTNPANYNQAIMDYGATVCKPISPHCNDCCLSQNCFAFKKDIISDLPIKSKKIKVKHRHFIYVMIECQNKFYFQKRMTKDIWQELYEPFLIEVPKKLTVRQMEKVIVKKMLPPESGELMYIGRYRQRLTHQLIHSDWFYLGAVNDVFFNQHKSHFYGKEKIVTLALPKTIISVLSKNNYL